MTGHGYEAAILDLARGQEPAGAEQAALRAHLSGCPACAARLVREQELTAGLRALSHATGRDRPSAGLEDRLLESFATMHRSGVARRSRQWRTWAGAAAAMIVMACIVFAWRVSREVDGIRRTVPVEESSGPGEFVAWPGAAALPAFESGQLVRTELPATVLPMLGIVPARELTSHSVAADLMVGQDGFARAVRLVQD